MVRKFQPNKAQSPPAGQSIKLFIWFFLFSYWGILMKRNKKLLEVSRWRQTDSHSMLNIFQTTWTELKTKKHNLVVKHEKCSIEEVVDGVKTPYFYSDCYNNRMLCCWWCQDTLILNWWLLRQTKCKGFIYFVILGPIHHQDALDTLSSNQTLQWKIQSQWDDVPTW
jgi:hypothetical protein